MPWNGSDEAVVVVDEDDERFEVLRVAFFCVPPLVFLAALPDLFAFLDLSFFLFFPCCCCCVFVFRIDVLPAFFRCSFACQYFLIEASFEEKIIGRKKVFGKINPKDIRVVVRKKNQGKRWLAVDYLLSGSVEISRFVTIGCRNFCGLPQ